MVLRTSIIPAAAEVGFLDLDGILPPTVTKTQTRRDSVGTSACHEVLNREPIASLETTPLSYRGIYFPDLRWRGETRFYHVIKARAPGPKLPTFPRYYAQLSKGP